jgi:hypothetical protein
MANVKISALPAVSAIDASTDAAPIISLNGGSTLTTYKATLQQLTAASLAAPGPIGSTTSNTGAFTQLAYNNASPGFRNITAGGATEVLTSTSNYIQHVEGTGTQTIQLPDETAIPVGFGFIIDNDATGNVTVNNSDGTLLVTVLPGMAIYVYSAQNATPKGGWNGYVFVPGFGTSGLVQWGSTGLNMGNNYIDNARIGALTPNTGAFTTLTASSSSVISVNSASTALRITQTGTGNALVVEDSANPDSTPFVVDANGLIGIGGTPSAGNLLQISKNITGSTFSTGTAYIGLVQSDVTSRADVFTSYPSTQATAFTLSSLNHYLANSVSIGAGSSITTQAGFNASSGIVGATNNYGFYSNIASGTGRWNFYANGTAANYFGGPITFKPLASATPANNGDLTFEATSNTSLTVRLKGTDGVVRSATLALI